MSCCEALGVDPVHLRELAEARAEQFEGFRTARARFGEPIAARRERSRHGDCGWRLADVMPLRAGPGYVNRTVFPYGGEIEPNASRRPVRVKVSGKLVQVASDADRGRMLAAAVCR